MSERVNNVPLKGLNSLGNDAFFLRLTDNKNHFLHPEPSADTKDGVGYIVKEGAIGAIILTKTNADLFIADINANNLEAVHVKEVLGSDESEN